MTYYFALRAFTTFPFFLCRFSSCTSVRLADLASAGVFAAGFLESSGMKSRGNDNVFDLLVDVGSRDVVVSEHAKEVPTQE